jgi:exodeoxyribonuclease VII small subunit
MLEKIRYISSFVTTKVKPMPKKKVTEFNVEDAMEDLETIVDEMESGELSLEQAMEQFEKGVKLTRDCHKALQQAEQKVKILLEKQGELADFAIDDLIEESDDD